MQEQYKVSVQVTQEELEILQAYRASTPMYQRILLNTAIIGAAACLNYDNVVQLFSVAS